MQQNWTKDSAETWSARGFKCLKFNSEVSNDENKISKQQSCKSRIEKITPEAQNKKDVS
jgi:hypothetical protein